MELLRIVNYRKLVRRDHLEIIHPEYRHIKQRTNIINRSISKLFSCMCLDKCHEERAMLEGSSPAVLSVDRAGAILLGEIYKPRMKRDKRRIGTKEYVFRSLPANYYHIHGVNDLEVQTIQSGLEVIQWNLEHDNQRKFHFDEDYNLIPDVFTIVASDNQPFMFFIEYDTGSEGMPAIDEKLFKYNVYKRCGAWRNEWWVTDVKYKVDFPKILFVTEMEDRIKTVHSRASKLSLDVLAMTPSEYMEKLIGLTTR